MLFLCDADARNENREFENNMDNKEKFSLVSGDRSIYEFLDPVEGPEGSDTELTAFMEVDLHFISSGFLLQLKKSDFFFSCICPVTDNEFPHNIVKLVFSKLSSLLYLSKQETYSPLVC